MAVENYHERYPDASGARSRMRSVNTRAMYNDLFTGLSRDECVLLGEVFRVFTFGLKHGLREACHSD
jgi:hypothetical protein